MSGMTALFVGPAASSVQLPAVSQSPLTDLAEMAGIELLVIDESIDVQTFAKEVRWNELYWRLA